MQVVDHLVNNAGIESICLVEEITDMTNLKALMVIFFFFIEAHITGLSNL